MANTFTPDALDYTPLQTFKPGDRVELHPGCDLWMRGAKYGTVIERDARWLSRWGIKGCISIRMDARPYTTQLPPERLRHVR